VAAAGCASSVTRTSSDAIALSGWQLTLDALDTLQSLEHNAIPAVPSESAASLYKVFLSHSSFVFSILARL